MNDSPELRQSIAFIVARHADEASSLWCLRQTVLQRRDLTLLNLADVDDRLDAHVDAMRVIGNASRSACDDALGLGGPGEAFASTLLWLESRDTAAISRNIAIAQANTAMEAGLLSAFGWVSPEQLRGIVRKLADDCRDAYCRMVVIAACALHGVDPGNWLSDAVRSDDAVLRRRALRTAGTLGRVDLLSACIEALGDADENCRHWAAWSAVLLGDRRDALEPLVALACSATAWAERAGSLAFSAMSPLQAHEALKRRSRAGDDPCRIIDRVGLTGDPKYVPWLIDQMRLAPTAQRAGDAFSLMTGADLVELGLRRETFRGAVEQAQGKEAGADLGDPGPWPDPERVEAWWRSNRTRYEAGVRHFLGARLQPTVCLSALKQRGQRLRTLAAQHLCLMQPGTPLFNTRAPAWRQQRLLEQAVRK